MTESLVATQHGAISISDDEFETLRRTVCKDLDNNELKLFVAFCVQRKLHPLAKHVYPFKSGGRLSFITSIDAMRTIAHRSGQYDGSEGPYWCGKDGKWVDVWLSPERPLAAKFIDYRKDCAHPFVGIILASEYQGQTVAKSMPTHMLAKAAEAIAHRKAFPEDLGGMYEKDEMPPEIDVTPHPPPKPANGRLSLATVTQAPAVVDAEVVGESPAEPASEPEAAFPGEPEGKVYADPVDVLKAIKALKAVGIEGEDLYSLLGGDAETKEVDVDHVLPEDLEAARAAWKKRAKK